MQLIVYCEIRFFGFVFSKSVALQNRLECKQTPKTMVVSESPSQPFLVSSRKACGEERCVTRLKTAAREITKTSKTFDSA